MTTKDILDQRMIAALRQTIAEAEAAGQKARAKRLRAMLAEVEASR